MWIFTEDVDARKWKKNHGSKQLNSCPPETKLTANLASQLLLFCYEINLLKYRCKDELLLSSLVLSFLSSQEDWYWQL